MLSNNEPILLKQSGVAINQWDVRSFSDMVGASFISSREIIGKRADALARFARATQKAMAYTVENQDEALAIAVSTIGNIKQSDVPFFKQVLAATCAFCRSSRGYGNLDAEKYGRSIDELVSLGLIKVQFPVERILHPLIEPAGM